MLLLRSYILSSHRETCRHSIKAFYRCREKAFPMLLSVLASSVHFLSFVDWFVDGLRCCPTEATTLLDLDMQGQCTSHLGFSSGSSVCCGNQGGANWDEPCGKVLELEEWVYLLDMLHAELDRNASIERFEETLCWDRSHCLEMPLPKKITCSTRVW